MATSSFDRVFKVRDAENARELIRDIQTPSKVFVAKRDYELDKKRGIELLTRRSSVVQDNYTDNDDFIRYIEEEFGVGIFLDLHKSMIGKYGTPKFGTGRATYLSKYCVFKVPVSVDGFRLNDLEGSTISIGEPNKVGYIPIARSRVILIKGIPIVVMEKVIEADITDIKNKIGKVPDFVSSVDMGQVGFNKNGNLVAFDYAVL